MQAYLLARLLLVLEFVNVYIGIDTQKKIHCLVSYHFRSRSLRIERTRTLRFLSKSISDYHHGGEQGKNVASRPHTVYAHHYFAKLRLWDIH